MGDKARTVRKRCKDLLRTLDVQPPFRIEEFCRQLGERRGRPIRLIEWPIPVPGPFGVWMSRPGEDCIFYQQQTSFAHQRHIILHEIGHIICEHDSNLSLVESPDFSPPLPGGLEWRGLRRNYYSEVHEYEAESVATTILAWVATVERIVPRSSPVDPVMFRGLNSRRGWL
ncbi:hypothetical protein LZ318_31990 [Saccharopolyspora indica]|uniref:ImmA/IrrE family metallo-endopeptidase n=1 Tax=Saccharopolyspora indica TaxID=1229659 RepID=UPI0022EB3D97|nr:hypothetical protein [Saccharopolyspora indica]MDA3644140.1 hypothetical protein [Saccharopolyspora indica]